MQVSVLCNLWQPGSQVWYQILIYWILLTSFTEVLILFGLRAEIINISMTLWLICLITLLTLKFPSQGLWPSLVIMQHYLLFVWWQPGRGDCDRDRVTGLPFSFCWWFHCMLRTSTLASFHLFIHRWWAAAVSFSSFFQGCLVFLQSSEWCDLNIILVFLGTPHPSGCAWFH